VREPAASAEPSAADQPESPASRDTVLEPQVPLREPVSFGPVSNVDERAPLWEAVRTTDIPQRPDSRYFRAERTIRVAMSHLSIVDVTQDFRKLLVMSEAEAKLRLYETATGGLLSLTSVDGYERFGSGDFAFSRGPGDPEVLFARDAGISVIDPATGQILRTASHEGGSTLAPLLHGQLLSVCASQIPAQRSRLVFFRWQGAVLERLLTLDLFERVDGWDLDPTARRLVVALYPSNRVVLLDLERKLEVWSRPAPEYARPVAFAPDGSAIAVGGARLAVLDPTSGAELAEHRAFANNIHRVTYAPTNDVLVATAYDGRARLFSHPVKDGKLELIGTLRHQGSANVYGAVFSEDGRRLVTSSGDQTVRIWSR
jgi:hypothetical protein